MEASRTRNHLYQPDIFLQIMNFYYNSLFFLQIMNFYYNSLFSSVDVYKCNLMAADCSQCQGGIDPKYKCSWCTASSQVIHVPTSSLPAPRANIIFNSLQGGNSTE